MMTLAAAQLPRKTPNVAALFRAFAAKRSDRAVSCDRVGLWVIPLASSSFAKMRIR
jgi:hypothetical protein